MVVPTRSPYRLSTRYAGLSASLLLVGTYAEFGWHWAPVGLQAEVWNVSQAVFALTLLGALGWAVRGFLPWTVLGLLGGLALTTAGCGIAWLLAPWPLVAGVSQCSQFLQFPVAIVTGAVAGFVACIVETVNAH